MRRTCRLKFQSVLIFLALAALSLPASAQNNPLREPASSEAGAPATAFHVTDNELIQFDQFLDQHPKTARELWAQVGRIEQPRFQRNHPALMKFLDSHSGLRGQLLGHPYWFIRREHRYNEVKTYSDNLTRVELDKFDDFLEAHPKTARDIERNPGALRSPVFLKEHREVQAFLLAHPEIEKQILAHPSWFMTMEHWNQREANGVSPPTGRP